MVLHESECVLSDPVEFDTQFCLVLEASFSRMFHFSQPTIQLTRLLSVSFLAGLFLILGLMLYPAGWGSDKVQLFCGPDAAPYRAGLCSMGWAFYTAMGGTVLTFICAVFSAQAEIATSSDKVQEEIEEGKSLICLLWGFANIWKEKNEIEAG